MKKDLDKLRQKDMCEECDKSTLAPEQLRTVESATDQTLLPLQLLEKFMQANYEHVFGALFRPAFLFVKIPAFLSCVTWSKLTKID